jgi:predicted phosphodiesterase
MTDWSRKRIGLIADSHGNLEATAQVICLLERRGADLLVHLGDFCDSVRHDRAAMMINLLREHGVLAVKGNNDFLVENMLAETRRRAGPDGERTLAFLRTVPITRAVDGLRFAHSLPFDSIRSFYVPIDIGNTLRAVQLFAEADFEILFCGHSHLPIRFRKAAGRVTRESVRAGRTVILKQTERHILVVGAADDGECALYDREAGTYERLRIFE